MPLLTFRFVSQDNLPSRLIEMEEAAPYPIAHVGVITDDGKYEFGARLGVNGSLTGRSGVQYRPVNYADFTSEVYVQLNNPGAARRFLARGRENTRRPVCDQGNSRYRRRPRFRRAR